jgi:hypothetical protein
MICHQLTMKMAGMGKEVMWFFRLWMVNGKMRARGLTMSA